MPPASNILRFLAGSLAERLRFGKTLGLTHDGRRDTYGVFGWPQDVTLADYREMYDRGGIAKRIVEAYPRATWRGGIELYEDENPEATTPFEQAWDSIEERLNPWYALQKADTLAGLSTFSVLLLGAPGDLSSELPKAGAKGADSLLYLTPFVGGLASGNNRRISTPQQAMQIIADATVFEYDTDTKSVRFGEPISYTLRRTDFTSPAMQRPVHWSRIIHIAEGCLDDNVFGVPTLQNVYNLLLDLQKVTGAGAEAFWLRANQGLHLDIDKDMSLTTEGQTELAKLQEQAEAYENQLTRMLRTRGVSVQTLGSDVANFGPSAEAIITQIAGSKGIPVRILTGSERGDLASTQDANNFDTQIQDRRTGYVEPMIIRRFVDRLIDYGYLPTPGEKGYEIGWPEVETLSEEAKAKGAQLWAATNQAAGTPIYLDSEIREHWHDLKPLDEKDLKAQMELHQASQPPQLQGMGPDGKPLPVGPDGKPTQPTDNAKPQSTSNNGNKGLFGRAAEAPVHFADGYSIGACGEMSTSLTDDPLDVTCLSCRQYIPDTKMFEEELTRILEAAIECDATEVIDAIISLSNVNH